MKKGMMRRLRVSPALVVAILALFLALTGTAVSASGLITGKQIKNSSITGADVKNKSLTPKDFKGSVRGPRGLTGPAGATGATGPKGDKGDKGDPGAPNPDATTLNGFAASDLARATSSTATVNTSTTPATNNSVITAFNTTKQGGLLVELDFSCGSFLGTTNTRWNVQPTVDNVARGSNGLVFFAQQDVTGDPYDNVSVSAFVSVAPGAHTLGYTATRSFGDGSLDCNINESAVFVPFNKAGTPASTTPTPAAIGGANAQ